MAGGSAARRFHRLEGGRMADNSETRPVSAAPRDRDGARKRAQNHFTASEQRDTAVKQMIAAERMAREANTAKLRALRLAKEAADRETARLAALNAPPVVSKKKPRRIVVK
jgi:hypothetical protein